MRKLLFIATVALIGAMLAAMLPGAVIVFVDKKKAAAAGFTDPNSLDNCVLWLDFNDTTTVTVSASGGTNFITQIDDKSTAGGNDAAQDTAADRPWYISSGINGLYSLEGDGTDNDHLDFDSWPRMSAAHIFVVCRPRGDMIGQVRNGGPWDIGTDNKNHHFGGTLDDILDDVWQTTRVDVGDLPSATNQTYIYDASANSTNVFVYLDSTLVYSNLSATKFTNNANPTLMSVSYYWNGWIGEVVMYSEIKDSTDAASVRSYLSDKWQ